MMVKKSGMIDISRKPETQRLARSRVFVRLGEDLVKKIRTDSIPKGNVLESARMAGIMAAKKTAGLIPLCHNIEIECLEIEFAFKKDGLLIESSAKAQAKTGVEMEAAVACSIAALTVYDMCKMFSKSIEITGLCLVEKRGGRSGRYRRK
ncbi:cyclic pyranopterin monophosphate synthase MoaC [Candidatus Omnitrophota bacterium]